MWERIAGVIVIVIWLVATVINYHNFFVVWPANDEVRFYHQANVNEMAKYLDAARRYHARGGL